MSYSADQIALRSHLEAEAAATKAKLASGEYTFATYYTTDLEHWAEMEVFSIEDLRRHDAIACYSDTSKEVYGFRMRMDFDKYTTEEIEAELDKLYNRAEEDQRYEETRKLKEIEDEKDAAARLGVSLETYLRWQEEAGQSTSRKPDERW